MGSSTTSASTERARLSRVSAKETRGGCCRLLLLRVLLLPCPSASLLWCRERISFSLTPSRFPLMPSRFWWLRQGKAWSCVVSSPSWLWPRSVCLCVAATHCNQENPYRGKVDVQEYLRFAVGVVWGHVRLGEFNAAPLPLPPSHRPSLKT